MTRPHDRRVLPVHRPARRVRFDVLPNIAQAFIAANHMLMETSLPDGLAGDIARLIDLPRGEGFEASDDLGQRVTRRCLGEEYQSVDVVGHEDETVERQI